VNKQELEQWCVDRNIKLTFGQFGMRAEMPDGYIYRRNNDYAEFKIDLETHLTLGPRCPTTTTVATERG
jgi:hypothetical protein